MNTSVKHMETEIKEPITPDTLRGKAKEQSYLSYLEEECLTNPQVLIEISSVCNFHCDYCISKEIHRKKMFMEKDLYFHILKQLKTITRNPVRLHVSGEPTIHPDFHEIAKKTNAEGHDISLATNASNLKPEFLDIKMIVVIYLSTNSEELEKRTAISFDAYWQKIFTYLERWKQVENQQRFFFLFYLSKKDFKNEAMIEAKEKFVFDMLAKLDVDYSTDGGNPLLIARCRKGKNSSLIFSKTQITEGGLYPGLNPNVKYSRDFGFCDSPWKRLTVLADGRVGFCCNDLTGETTFTKSKDSLYEKDLKDLWLNDPNLNRVREAFKNKKAILNICRKCMDRVPTREIYIPV